MKSSAPSIAMKKVICCTLLAASLFNLSILSAAVLEGGALSTSKEPVTIAKDGKALLPITIAPGSSEATKKSAAFLADTLKKITGAEFSVAEGTEPKGITLGTLQQFPDQSLQAAIAIKDVYDGIEAYAINSEGGNIRLLGNSDLGVSHAVSRFLDIIGCRWFFPGATWEVIPQDKNLTFASNENSRPAIWTRSIWFGRTNQPWEPGDPDGTAIFNEWTLRNRLGESLKVNASHRWHAIPTDYKEEFDAHPEYFALVDGKRTPPQLCVTNPGLQKAVIRYANDYLAKNPAADMVSVDPADQPGWCTCDECKKLGHHSNQAFFLANIVARDIAKTHPGKYVGLLAYSWHSEAPPFQLEPNVYVQLTAGMNASKFTFDELFKLWTEKCSHVGIYEYYSYWEMDKGMFPGIGVSNRINEMDERLQGFANKNVNSISAQSANCWGVNGLGYYVASRLMWSPNANVSDIKKDFYEKAFGPAAAPMERYYERLNLSNKPMPGKALIRQSIDDIEEAIKLAGKRPDVLARLDALRENIVYNYIGRQVEDAVALEDQKKTTLDWFTWSYRTRNNYMNDWITFRSAVGRPADEVLKEPTWFWRNTVKNPEVNPWRKNDPVTPVELTERLAQIKAEIGDVPKTPEATYSNDYVLVNSGRAGDGETKMIFSGSATFLIASKEGEPLQFHLLKRDTGQWDRPDTKYWLSTLDGKEITAGELGDGGHDLVLKVPGPGIYQFSAKAGGPGWEVTMPRELNNALTFERGGQTRPGYVKESYFYVPKGTKEIVLYAEKGGAVTVRDPSDNIAKEVRADGSQVAIPVAEGADGKVWSVAGKFRNLWFFNVPTVLSPSPRWVFVPTEVAKNDGLEVALPR